MKPITQLTLDPNIRYKGSRMVLEVRFWKKARKTKQCWYWLGHKNPTGYGRFYVGELKTDAPAHRIAYILHFGSIPDGMHVCHRCDNPSCVNPDHLFLGTYLDNVRDCVRKGRRWGNGRGENSTSAKLTNAQVREIRETPYRYGVFVELSKKYKICKSSVFRIYRGQSYLPGMDTDTSVVVP